MKEFLWFILGLFIGGIVSTLVLCCLQINRVNDCEEELQRLRSQLDKKQ